MTAALTSAERLSRMDHEVEQLKQAFVDAAVQLTQAAEVDASHDERWVEIAKRLHSLRTELRPDDLDKGQLAVFLGTLFDIRDLMDEPRTLDTLDLLVMALERVRHVIRDALDEHVAGVRGDVALVVGELLERMDGVTRDTVAELLGVDRRTVARWKEQSGPPPRRLAVVAALVAILRHNWTPDGIVDWFHRPRRDLGGRKPIVVLGDDRFDEDALVSSARAGRSQYAS